MDLLQLMMRMYFIVESLPKKEGSSESCAVKDAQCKLVVPTERPTPRAALDATELPGTQS